MSRAISIVTTPLQTLMQAVLRRIDSDRRSAEPYPQEREDRVEWARLLPFAAMHVGCVLAPFFGVSAVALLVAAGLYLVRMFAITAFYHRYFSHRTFKTSRTAQFVFALLGTSAGQRGPLWWAAHHRRHHKHSDTERDSHSPHRGGFLWSHIGWFTTRRNYRTDHAQVRDLVRHPELRWLDRFDVVVPMALAAALYLLGEALAAWAPGTGTDGLQMLTWGFCVSTTLLFHATSTINSLGHLFGRRRYETPDHSRNSMLLALLTLGEGWHNNHHFYPVAVRQGFRWWELDLCYYGLRAMAALGIVWDLREVPPHVRSGRRAPEREAA